jgi:DNA-binding Lrp family transcriptional regulator
MVRDEIANAGPHGATTNEIAERLGIDRGSVQPRTSELKLFGVIEDSGQRRFNRNGKAAIVWVLSSVEEGPGDV